MPSSDEPNIIMNGDLDDVAKFGSTYPYVTPAGQVDSRAVAANELLKLRSDIAKLTGMRADNLNLSYDTRESIIHIGNRSINLKSFSKEAMLCNVVLRNKRTVNKNWSPDEVVEKWPTNEPAQKDYKQRNASDAADRINNRFKSVGLPDLFMPPTGQNLIVNPIYL